MQESDTGRPRSGGSRAGVAAFVAVVSLGALVAFAATSAAAPGSQQQTTTTTTTDTTGTTTTGTTTTGTTTTATTTTGTTTTAGTTTTGTTTTTPTTTTTTTTTPSGPAGQIRLSDGSISIPVTSVTPPDRLVIDRVSFQPNPLRSRRSVLTGRFRVSNQANGYRVRDALVYGIALPYGQFRPAAEVTTGTDGYATIRFIPTANLHTGRNSTIQFFLRARKPGDPLLSGVSIRRLVQATVLVR
ncbi:MAG: hypothetical protein QOF50_1850 [Gaiellaceae bacterium]|nr:hypothetical protein [Gaiellaceae bacterium]